MADTVVGAKTRRQSANWRHRENRASTKYVAKRVSADDHQLLAEYASSLDVTMAELLTPAIQDLLEQARQHQSAQAS